MNLRSRGLRIFIVSVLAGIGIAIGLRFAASQLWSPTPGSFYDVVLDGIAMIAGIIACQHTAQYLEKRSKLRTNDASG